MKTQTTFTVSVLALIAGSLAIGSPIGAQQDPHAQMNARGAMVMGFDQDKTTHHFYLYQDGGAIDISVDDAADLKNRDAIRSHLPHIAMMFGQGDFEAPMLVHDTKAVPGTDAMAKAKDKITYTMAGGIPSAPTYTPANSTAYTAAPTLA